MRRRARRATRKDGTYLSPAQESDTARPLGRIFLSFPRACLARARNPEFRWRTWGRTGILRAAATRENDRARARARRNCRYDLQRLNKIPRPLTRRNRATGSFRRSLARWLERRTTSFRRSLARLRERASGAAVAIFLQ